MGRSTGGGKRLSSESRQASCDLSSAKSNVAGLLERLENLRADHQDILQLESVRQVISALEDGNSPAAGESGGGDSSEDLPDSCRQLENVSPVSSASGAGRIKGTTMKISTLRNRGKSQKCHQNPGTSQNVTSGGGGASDPATAVEKVTLLNAKRGCARLIRNFEQFYKRVAKKYFFMLKPRKPSKSNFFGVFFSILAFIFYFELHTINGFSRLWLKWENVDLGSVECTIESPNLAMELFRPPVSCAICHNVKSADHVSVISPQEFERVYAYTGRPVIVTDAMTNWTAPSAFSFEFFKGIYSEGSRSLLHLDEDCLFFPYQTEFRSLADVFNMTKERSQHRWYIGWSNCDAETSHILRQHYQRPYFLPETAESTHADWIFMGTSGNGAHMHIDHVINPSWQGQIKGVKRWYLQPPPECFYECQSFHVDVHPGDIIVLDTNKWYHQTDILPGENSITIGSEYD